MQTDLSTRLKNISTLILDVDGVFTNGTLQVTDSGINRTFHVRDGYAIQMALKSGLRIAIISGAKQENVRSRLLSLGISEIHLAVPTDGKPAAYQEIRIKWGLTDPEVAYMGDDIPDLLIMQQFEVFKACPADAEEEVLGMADYISPCRGGHGAVRDFIKQIMLSKGLWMTYY